MGWVRVEPFCRIPLPGHDMLAHIDTPKFYIQTQFYHYYQFFYLNQQIILIKEEKYVSKKEEEGKYHIMLNFSMNCNWLLTYSMYKIIKIETI